MPITSTQNVALVVGDNGVIGHTLAGHLAGLPDWQVIGISRRAAAADQGWRHLSVDLLDAAQARAALTPLRKVTHIFHAAYLPHDDAATLEAQNLAMLRNVVEPLAAETAGLRRVILYQGAKYYGAHLGAFPTPARETDARQLPPNFYYAMQDWLLDTADGRPWDALMLRPDLVCTASAGSPMNIVVAIAVYASLSKSLGLPLRFPGSRECYTRLAQATGATQLARGSAWAARHGMAGEAYNLTNGDLFRWHQLWAAIAEWFDMPLGEPMPVPLSSLMRDKGPLWQSLVTRHQLRPIPYHQLVTWEFADFILRCDWDVICSVTKIRQAGFHDTVDTTAMFLHLLDELRTRRIIP